MGCERGYELGQVCVDLGGGFTRDGRDIGAAVNDMYNGSARDVGETLC